MAPPGVPLRLPPGGKAGLIIGGALLLGALLWNWWNNREPEGEAEDDPEVSWGQASAVGQSRYRIAGAALTPWVDLPPNCRIGPSESSTSPVNWSEWGQFSSLEVVPEGPPGICGGRQVYRIYENKLNGDRRSIGFAGRGQGFVSFRWFFAWEFRNGAVRDTRAPVAPERTRDPGRFPLPIGPVPAPAPAPQPLPKRPPAPALPDAEPLPPQPEAEPEPGQPPRRRPPLAPPIAPDRPPLRPPGRDPDRVPPRPPEPPRPGQPQPDPPPLEVPPFPRLPGPVVIGIDGRPRLNPPGPIVPTPPGQVDLGPVVVGDPARRPAPTLEGIAAELGKLEDKLDFMLRKPEPELPEPIELPEPVDLGPLLELVGEIAEVVLSPFEADSYELQPPCGRTPGGAPLPPDVAAWPAGVGKFNQLAVKIDALALLIQYAKDQRQPICKGKPIGEEVSVNFIEVP